MRHPILARYIDAIHRRCSGSRHLVSLALKVRNQANAVIRARMADGIRANANGEQLLIDVVAPQARSFIDVGANVGAWTQAFSKKCARPAWGCLFEPSPNAHATLLHAVEDICRDDTLSLEVLCQALGDAPGEIPFYAEPNAGETSSFVFGHSARSATRIMVPVGTLDTELAKRSIDMVKIDAEGFDCKVLRGATEAMSRQALGVIQFEYNGPWALAGDTLYAAIGLASRSGYETFLLKNDGLFRFDWKRYGEFFGYSNFIAVSPPWLATLMPIVVGDI